jgi:hypothetical protein
MIADSENSARPVEAKLKENCLWRILLEENH